MLERSTGSSRRSSLVDLTAAEENRRRLQRLRAEELGKTRFNGSPTFERIRRAGSYEPPGRSKS